MSATNHSIICVAGLLIGNAMTSLDLRAQDVTTVELIDPNPEIQWQIDEALTAARNTGGGGRWDALYEELAILKNSVGGDNVELIRQLAHATNRLRNAEENLILLRFIRLLEIDDSAVIAAMAPYLNLENSVGKFARLCFRGIDDGKSDPRRPLEPVNYNEYMNYVHNRLSWNEPVPEAFVRYIFSRRPSQAFLVFVYAKDDAERPREGPQALSRSEQTNEFLWAEHVVRDAIWRKENGFETEFQNVKRDATSALQKLAIHNEWWVRLYVAEIIQKYPYLRSDSLIERLSKDENELVREVMQGGAANNPQ